MKIPAVSYISGNHYIQTKSFNGLWGKTSVNTDIEPTLGINAVFETYYYYPFQDETLKEIEDVVNSTSYNRAYMDYSGIQPKYVVKECKQCSYLPFKKINFEKYREAGPDAKYTTNHKKVHAIVKNDRMFTNNAPDNQISAENPVFRHADEAKNYDSISM